MSATENNGESVYDRVVRLVAAELHIDEATIKPESDFVNDLHADSLDMVEMIMKIEEEFDDLHLPEDVNDLTTVQQLVDFIEKETKQ